MISRSRVLELVSYNRSTGEIIRNNARGRAKKGNVAGHLNERGYRIICLDRKKYRAHHLVWLIEYGEWPLEEIDHINHVTDDNRICNLRAANRSQNTANRRIQKNSTTGFKGVFRKGNHFRSQITVRGKFIWLGSFSSKSEARSAYLTAAHKYFGEFAHG